VLIKSRLLLTISLSLLSCSTFAATTTHHKNNLSSATKASNVQQPAKPQLVTEKDKLSYTLGVQLGHHLKRQGVDINSNLLAAGLRDVNEGNRLLMTEDQMKETITTFQKQLVDKRAADFKLQAHTNAQQGEEFLVNNAKQPGVHTLPNGLQYKIITAGTGISPKVNDIVTVNYVGKFINGKVFDSSDQHGQPATFPVSEVIPGWREALKMMQPGATWELYVPSKLAYGEQGMSDVIGPNQTLIFNVQLLSVKSNTK
jgi:FKBP-type peptidyl-prolyl cis-trans isomerase FklB